MSTSAPDLGQAIAKALTPQPTSKVSQRGQLWALLQVPLLAFGVPVQAGVNLGTRSTFADLGQTLAQAFAVGQLAAGTSFAHELGLL